MSEQRDSLLTENNLSWIHRPTGSQPLLELLYAHRRAFSTLADCTEASQPSATCASPLGHLSLTHTSHQALDQEEKEKTALVLPANCQTSA